MKLELETDVPMPADRKQSKYFFGQYAIGQSYLYPDGEYEKEKIQTAAYKYGKYNSKAFSVHGVEGGTRVWRTA